MFAAHAADPFSVVLDPMKSISFSWTSAALVARAKDVTRREWNDEYADRFEKDEVIKATDRQVRFGGKLLGLIRLTAKPYWESEALMPDRDYAGEGYEWLDAHPWLKPKSWQGVDLKAKFEYDRRVGETVCVVRFAIEEMFAQPCPRCDFQQYDRGTCGMCDSRGFIFMEQLT